MQNQLKTSQRAQLALIVFVAMMFVGSLTVTAAGGDRLSGVRSDMNNALKVFIPTEGLKVEVKDSETVKWTLAVNPSTPNQLDIAAPEGTSQKLYDYPIIDIKVTEGGHFKVFTFYTMVNYLLNSGGATAQDVGNIGLEQDKVFLKSADADKVQCMLMIEPVTLAGSVSAKVTNNIVNTGNYGLDGNCAGDQSKWFTTDEAAAVREIGALFFDATFGVKPPAVETTPEATETPAG